MISKYKRTGWYGESHRHSLAAQGIRTKINYAKNDLQSLVMAAQSEAVGERKERIGFSKVDYSMSTGIQKFLHTKFFHAELHKPHLKNTPEVIEAKQDIGNITNWEKFKAWTKKHKNVIILMGMGGLLGVAAVVSGVPTLMQNVETGEIIGVGGTLLGKWGTIGETVLTGLAVTEEVKIIGKEVPKEYVEEDLISPADVTVDSPTPKAFVIKVKPKAPQQSPQYSLFDENRSDDAEYGDLKTLSSPPIPWSELTQRERKVMYEAMRKTKKLLGKKGKKIEFNEKNFQVCQRVGPDDSAWGAHQGDLIQIDRDTLKDPNKTEGVVLHESIHKVYEVSDETRDLENLHIDYLGLAMRNE